MKAHIISIGDELLIGDTINTNAAWMGGFLTELGFKVERVLTIPDDKEVIKNAVSTSMAGSNIVFCSGGLGPTHDDMTKAAIAELFDARLIKNNEVYDFVESRLKKMNISMSESNKDQAMVPENCEVLFNSQGSAPGMWFCEQGSYLVVLPGVPHEMKFLMQERVLPKLKEHFPDVEYLHSMYVNTAGMGESTLSDELGDLTGFLNEDVNLAFLPFAGGVKLRINTKGENKNEALNKAKPLYDHIYKKAGNVIYGDGKDYHLSEEVGKILKKNSFMVATAESCTGGLLANTITNISGSAEYFMGGIIAYDNEIKIEHLGVNKNDIAEYGAVSKQVALQMAKGAAEKLKAEIGISTTGIAGPGGGSPEKPVGTVWIGFYSHKQHFAVQAQFSSDRLQNKERSVVVALEIIRRILLGIPEMPYGLKMHHS